MYKLNYWVKNVIYLGVVWWPLPVIPALRRWKQKDFKFKANLCHIASLRPAWTILIIRHVSNKTSKNNFHTCKFPENIESFVPCRFPVCTP
jgi:hypothetical protein